VARSPRRIVSLVPSVTETLFTLGLGSSIAGVTAYCSEPREGVASKIKIGGPKDPKLDLIRSLEPDLVVANVEENSKEHVGQLREWGIPVFVTCPRTVREGIGMIRELGMMAGAEDRAEAIIQEIEPLYRQAVNLSKTWRPSKVFYPVWRNPYMTVNRDTYIHDVLAVCGGSNVFADRPERYPEVTLDEMAAARPEVIMLPDEPYRFRKAHVEDFDRYPDVPAVRDGRIHLVDGKLFCWYGPRIREALQSIPSLLHI
jgi:ABC-type Fe3+-hydroxamate transport system substrate-binding protein